MNSKNEKSVLACIDGSAVATSVCDYACWISEKLSVPLKLFHAVENIQDPAVSDYTGAIGLGSQQELLNELTQLEQNRSKLLIKKGQLMLNAGRERALKSGITDIELLHRHGTLIESLIEFEESLRVIVMGIRGENHADDDRGVGAQIETVVRALNNPILLVNDDFAIPTKIMLAYDGSESCEKALSMIANSPLLNDLPCHLVHVGDHGESILQMAKERLEKSNVRVTVAELEGNIAEALSKYQLDNQIDLMMMGAFGHNRIRNFLLGSFTVKMMMATKRPLLLLR